MEPRPPFWKRRNPYLWLGGALVLAAIAGALTGAYLRTELPDVRSLEDYQPPEMTRVLDREGEPYASFAEERRLSLDFGEIPETFQQALIAAEDSDFPTHPGIDLKGIARAVLRDVVERRKAQGASTLTQQLARNLFLHREKTFRRKAQEALLALEIERRYSKEEILRFYANQVYMGHGRYGLEAAARHYFAKPARELNLSESATLVGLLPRPEGYSPLKNLERATERRNYVLRRMADEGYIDEATARATMELPIEVSPVRGIEEEAPFFTEEVRRWLQERYGATGVYKEGLVVRTTMDRELQAVAERAVENGLRALDKRQGWRPDDVRRVPEDDLPETWESPDWTLPPAIGDIVDGVVMAADRRSAEIRVAERRGTLTEEDVAWTEETRPDRLLDRGDVVRVRLVAEDDDGRLDLELEQEPAVEGALVALDPHTGEVVAMVGGYDFRRSEFNRAVQAQRQTGSAFKPFVYAAALDDGWTLADVLLDEPTVFLDRRRPDPYQPENFSRKYYETVTLRQALERSANIVTVKLLGELGYRPVIETAQRLGIDSELRPFPSLALGSFETDLMGLTAAYGAFANQGVRVSPHWIQEVYNRQGFALHREEPEVHDAVSPQVAYLMTQALNGVIQRGTGTAARRLSPFLAGKTGTTDDYTDAWFIGFSSSLAVGAWVGYDEPRSLGRSETGARAALPIWIEFMEAALETYPAEEFTVPPDISVVVIDRQTGKKANASAFCDETLPEVFLAGTEPTAFCSPAEARRRRLPYPFQRFPLDASGTLTVPRNRLDEILEYELDVFLDPRGDGLTAFTETGPVRVPLRIAPPEPEPPLGDLRTQFDVESWRGTDGRPARIVWMD